MKSEYPCDFVEEHRIAGYQGYWDGAYCIRRGSAELRIIASNGMGWDHVSVSLPTRCPTWEEMCYVKSLFFDEEECVMQLHPPRSQWINNHPYCLHLWRPQSQDIPRPPSITVGIQSLGELTKP